MCGLIGHIGPDLTGIDPATVGEDFKVGMQQCVRWERLAVVTDEDWIKPTVRPLSFLMPGEIRGFPTSEASKARDWIVAAQIARPALSPGSACYGVSPSLPGA